MPAVFPVLGYIGLGRETGPTRFTRPFPDGTYRTTLKQSFVGTTMDVPIKGVCDDELAAIEAVVLGCNTSPTTDGFECWFYDYFEVGEDDLDEHGNPDPTGASTVGRHRVIFLEAKPRWVVDGEGTFSGTIKVFFLAE